MKVLSLQGRDLNIAVNTVTTGAPIDTPMSASHYTEEIKVGAWYRRPFGSRLWLLGFARGRECDWHAV